MVTTAAESANHNETIQSIDTWFCTLTPKDRTALREQYPDAFSEVERTDAESGRTYRMWELDTTKLTAEQANAIALKNGTLVQQTWERGDQMAPLNSDRLPQHEAQRRDRQVRYEVADTEYSAVIDNDDDQRILQAYDTFVQTEGSKPVIYNGTEMSMEDAAKAAYNDPSAKARSGYQSWRKAISVVGEDTELGQYMAMRYDLNGQRGEVFDKQEEWFNAQPENVRQLLIDENPDRYGKYADGSTTASSSTSTPVVNTDSGGGSSYSSGYYKASSGSSGRSSGGGSGFRASGSSSNGGGYKGQAATGSTNSFAVLSAADPFIAQGVDDGRMAHVQFVADWMDRLLAVVALNPNKGRQWAAWFQGAFMQWLTKQLGPNPTVESWMSISSRIQGPAGAQPQQAATPPVAAQASPAPLAMVGY